MVLKSKIGLAVATSALVAGSLAAVPTGSIAAASISPTQFNGTMSAMASLKPLAAKGKGKIEVILPDTTTSARWADFDAPLLAKAFKTAGLPSSQYKIQNAHGSASTQLTDAQAAISAGAKVIILTALDSGSASQIEKYATSHGAKVIDYDRLVLGGKRAVYVSFNNVTVGTQLGNGLVSCAAAWGVTNPKVIVMDGDPTDNNATLFAQGYDAVLKAKFASGWTEAANPAGTWDPPTALTEFTQALTANPGVGALLSPNDENAAPIIQYLQTKGVKPDTFPVTGQDATSVGLQNIVAGYQCGTVYKPIFEEAEGAAAAAVYLRAGAAIPKSLINGTTEDTTAKVAVPSILLSSEWVTAKTIESTVVKDNFVPASQICTSALAADCAKYGIK